VFVIVIVIGVIRKSQRWLDQEVVMNVLLQARPCWCPMIAARRVSVVREIEDEKTLTLLQEGGIDSLGGSLDGSSALGETRDVAKGVHG
jgi:hypothetical protein